MDPHHCRLCHVGCEWQGDYYSYSNYDGSVEDVSLLNVDNQFNLIYKDFTTGILRLLAPCVEQHVATSVS